MIRPTLKIIAALSVLGFMLWGWQQTAQHMRQPAESLSLADYAAKKIQVLDRNATPLNITYQNRWNVHDYVPLHEIPEILQQVFVLSEDKRFYQHGGMDWIARSHAMWQNIKSLEVVRGASTITEQVVRIIYPRPRTFWSRWLEGFEATLYEQKYSKAEILEFYLNQVPYAGQKRGVVQAARYYFNRDLQTLNLKEMMALSVLVRSPSRLDLKKGTYEIERPIKDLAIRLLAMHLITADDYQAILTEPLRIHDFALPIKATHFVNYIQQNIVQSETPRYAKIRTTLDASLQKKITSILQQRLADLKTRQVGNGAVLVVNHQTQEILAWVNANNDAQFSHYDAITLPRQPGSTLKPLLYALALEKGWTAATLIDDSQLVTPVGTGLHTYQNYSRHHYGKLRLRDALGNSLNIPAIRAVQYIGAETFLKSLRQLGMYSLDATAEFYGEGLALGNGGVSLLELVQAYTVLANRGVFKPLQSQLYADSQMGEQIFSPQVASIIADILSDADARRLEFGRSTLLRLPIETAVKTGTSTDYHDAWTLGFNHRYTVGVWLGNLSQQPMTQVSGASGAALVLRAVFAELNRHEQTQPLYRSPDLVSVEICRDTGLPKNETCPSRMELFIASTEPTQAETKQVRQKALPPNRIYLRQPTEGLQIALDPRIADEFEQFKFELSTNPITQASHIDWLLDGEIIATTAPNIRHYLWSPIRGQHVIQARVWRDQATTLETAPITFFVK
ncbi:transglycosylase domain-containing protein [Candidatus Albibeggiatoa sp. nov. NOAA]|uniref:transglycosylase domain-containing protein n=1 Tax=Candidatus Albibeggiatoa sp. nov. NOAA TaxID=3162724 RepID=UPI0032FDFF6C|nr:transglycosylase domain-containing protein [Thiotrichaceae bacterium]